MKAKDLMQLRLFNQGLTSAEFVTCADVVSHFGAIQAQDYAMAKWAVGMRMRKGTDLNVEHSLNCAEIIRTHILRPTWHFVHNKDIRWMMELSAPNIKKATQYVDKQVGLTDSLFTKVWKIIERELTHEDNLTKEELMKRLISKKVEVMSSLATQILIRAELKMLVCNGVRKGKQITYSIFDRHVSPAEKISRKDSLVKLATIYFKSRGPATTKDFMWWGGLNLTDARFAVNALGKKLVCTNIDGLNYLYFDPCDYPTKKTSVLLPSYDEFMVGYSEGRDIAFTSDLDKSMLGNGIFKPLVLYQNKIVGLWKKLNKEPFAQIQAMARNKKTLNMNSSLNAYKMFLNCEMTRTVI